MSDDLNRLFGGILGDLFANVPRGDRPAGVDPSSPAEVLRRAVAFKATQDERKAKSPAEVADSITAALRSFGAKP
jgi:hypothetical protein